MRQHRFAVVIFVVCWSWAGACLSATPNDGEWTRFRGPNGTGLSDAKGIPVTWTDKDYNWKIELPGKGHSSPVIWENRVFVTSAMEDNAERLVLCLDAETGKTIWDRRFVSSVHHKHKFNSFASSTPALDKDHIYLTWSTPDSYVVTALDHAGRDVWQVDLGPVVSQHSTAVSPIVVDDLVVIGNDQDSTKASKDATGDGISFWVALDCKDGRERWRTARESAVVSYSTPCVRKLQNGKSELIFNSQAHGISGVDPKTGKVNWEISVFDKRSVSSPIIAAGLIFGSNGSGGGGNYIAAVKPGPKPELAYKVDKMASYVPTLLGKDKYVFMFSDRGIGSCLEAATGNILWQQRLGGNFSGSPICVGKNIYCIDEDGTVVVIAAAPEFKLLGKTPLGEECRSTPAVAGGRMYLRTASHLMSLGGKKK